MAFDRFSIVPIVLSPIVLIVRTYFCISDVFDRSSIDRLKNTVRFIHT